MWGDGSVVRCEWPAMIFGFILVHRDLVLLAKPAAKIDELAAVGAEWKPLGPIGSVFFDRLFADGTLHDLVLMGASHFFLSEDALGLGLVSLLVGAAGVAVAGLAAVSEDLLSDDFPSLALLSP